MPDLLTRTVRLLLTGFQGRTRRGGRIVRASRAFQHLALLGLVALRFLLPPHEGDSIQVEALVHRT